MRFEVIKSGQNFVIRHKRTKVTFGPYSDKKQAKDTAKQLEDLMNSYKEFDEHFAAATMAAKQILANKNCQLRMMI